jgi:hypothetical protein
MPYARERGDSPVDTVDKSCMKIYVEENACFEEKKQKRCIVIQGALF